MRNAHTTNNTEPLGAAVVVVHALTAIAPGESENIEFLAAFAFTHAGPHSVCRKLFAEENI